MFVVAIVEGPGQGRQWPVPATGVVVGRSPACQIQIPDVLLSRRHCELTVEGDAVRVRDLGSRNALLVNGTATTDSLLGDGDRIACGRITLEVRRIEGEASAIAPAAFTPENGTSSTLKLGDAVFVQESIDIDRLAESPGAVETLAQLFVLARRFSRERSTGGLIEALLEYLREQFRPTGLWYSSYLGADQEVVLYPIAPGDEAVEVPRDLILRAQAERAGVLHAHRTRQGGTRHIETHIIAPVIVAGDLAGALALSTQTPQGAYDESDLQHLCAVADSFGPYLRAVERAEQLQRDNARLSGGQPVLPQLVGSSEAMRILRRQLGAVARGRQHVLLLGETGTGKELASRLVHDLSPRAGGPFVAFNCAAVQNELFESEIFGHERGAFTGAHQRKLGLYQQAHGGTLFLDEIGELSPENQARLLRTAENGRFRRVGATEELHADVRIVAATNRDVRAPVGQGGLRTDLYHRLCGSEIQLPPLRNRREDLPELIAHLCERVHAETGERKVFCDDALAVLSQHAWPGNVRELKNVVERACTMTIGTEIHAGDIVLRSAGGAGLGSMAEVERNHIAAVLAECQGNTAQAARILGIARSTLYNKLHEYRLGANART